MSISAGRRKITPTQESSQTWIEKYAGYALWSIPVAAVIVYANALGNPFIFDDKDFILSKNFYYSFGNLRLLFSNQYHLVTGEATFRPLSLLPFFFNYAVFGLEPAGWRILNILLHALNGLLVYSLIKTLSPKSKAAAILGALLFVVHPALSETINVVGFNDDIQATTFFLISLILYVKVTDGATKGILLWVSLFSYVAGLLSKESVVVLPLVLVSYEALRKERDLAGAAKRLAPFWIATAVFLAAFFTFFRNPNLNQRIPYLGGSRYSAFLNVPRLVLSYIGLLAVPVNLTVLHSYTASRELTMPVAGAFLLVALLIFGCFRLLREGRKNELFGALLFLLALAPVLNLIPLGIPIAERYVYLSAVGAVLFLSLFTERFVLKISTTRAITVAVGAAVAAILVLSAMTVQRNTIFTSDIRLWQDAVAKAPRQVLPMNNLAIAYRQAGRTDRAISILRDAIELNPRWTGPYVNLGVALEDVGKTDEAESLYRRALRIDPSDTQANNNLGGIYNARGEPDKALKFLLEAERLQPTNAVIQMNLGRAYEHKGLLKEALRRYGTAARLNPDFTAAIDNYNRLKASSIVNTND